MWVSLPEIGVRLSVAVMLEGCAGGERLAELGWGVCVCACVCVQRWGEARREWSVSPAWGGSRVGENAGESTITMHSGSVSLPVTRR